jgi:hypothetical protein
MANYPKGGFIDHGQEIQVARGANNSVVKLPELSVAWFSVAPKAKDAVGILSQKTITAGTQEFTPTAQPDVARQLVITGDATSKGGGVTISGADALGNAISETKTIPASSPYTVATSQALASVASVTVACSEKYVLALDSPTGGTFKLGNAVKGWTSDIAYNASAATIQTALEAVYGAGKVTVVTGSDFTITFSSGIVANLGLDSSLTDAAAAAVTLSGLGTVKVGLGQGIGIPAVANAPTVLAVYHDGGIVAPGTWTHTVDAVGGAAAKNIIDPGDTVGTAYNGTKKLDVYLAVAGVREG